MRFLAFSTPEGKPGQVLALGAPIVLAGALWVGCISPGLQWYRARQAEIGGKQAQVAQLLRLRLLLPALRVQVAEAEIASRRSQDFLNGNTDALAGADLQARLSALALHSGAQLTRIDILPGEMVNGLHQVSVEVALNANWQGCIALLSAIDLAEPRMIVSDLHITNMQGQGGALQIGFSVAAFRL